MSESIKDTIDRIKGNGLTGPVVNIAIIGNPASGKTYLSKHFADTHTVIHADDYMKYGYRESIYKIIEDLRTFKAPFVIEGVACYRLLRKLAEQKRDFFSEVIEICRDINEIEYVYADERPDKDWRKVVSMIKANETVLRQYVEMSGRDIIQLVNKAS